MNKEKIISGTVTNKRTRNMSPGWGQWYYVTIGTKELQTSAKIYNKLSIGDYISGYFKKNLLVDEDILVKLL